MTVLLSDTLPDTLLIPNIEITSSVEAQQFRYLIRMVDDTDPQNVIAELFKYDYHR